MLKIHLFALVLAGFSAISSTAAATITEDFSHNPLQNGWKILGNTNLFQWDATNQNLLVTWDSAQPNSYFYHPLGTILARDDDFTLAFDLQLTDIGPHPGPKTNTFQIAIGFLNLDQAAQANFIRGTGTDSPNLAELDYFWDSGFGATIYPAFVGTNSTFNYNGASDYAIFSLATGDGYHIVMNYSSSNQTLATFLTNFEHTSGVLITQLLNTNFADYRLGSVSISSYSDAGQDPQYAGSVLAHGIVDNLVVTVPGAPLAEFAAAFTNGVWRAQFLSRTDWVYTLERTTDLKSWTGFSPTLPGSGTQLVLTDTNAPAPAFYRVRANRP